ncbi:uncharacterized protein BDV14DRAFT_198993 [Aspergillus stella-maris]|uniref:uncharacterized protein n=1 Tax=Aspergillus stella-maris TaxID=1810926 RepID=UPI003CCE3B7B
MEDTSGFYPAPYGRSCASCSQSKCKCLYPTAGGRCRRCERLNKDCHQPTSSKRQSSRRAGVARSAQFMDKLDDLVSLLRAGVQPPGPDSINLLLGQMSRQSTSSSGHPSNSEAVESSGPCITRSTTLSAQSANLTPERNIPEVISQPPTPSELTPQQAEEYFSIFKMHFLPFFPCIYLPSEMKDQQLQEQRPFTWLCIMAVASKHASQRRALGDKVKSIVAERMILAYENTDIDILHGLLIFLGWSNQQIHQKPNLHVYTQLVNAAVYELGIHNPSAKSRMTPLCVFTDKGEDTRVAGQVMEERRAVLAAFLVTSIISTFLQKIDGLSWTPFMDEYLRQMEEEPECLNDGILAHQVRLQLSIVNLSKGRCGNQLHSTSTHIQAATSSSYLHSMHIQLQNFKGRLGPDSATYKVLQLHYHYSTLIFHETALTKVPSESDNLTYQQLDHHYGCLDGAKSWCDIFFTISPADYLGFPFSVFAQMVHTLVVIYQLSTFENELWDTAAVRERVDVLAILDIVIKNMSQVADLVGLEGGPESDVFSVIAKMYRSVQLGWEVNLAPDLLPPDDPRDVTGPDQTMWERQSTPPISFSWPEGNTR